jgi:hypothetical protein
MAGQPKDGNSPSVDQNITPRDRLPNRSNAPRTPKSSIVSTDSHRALMSGTGNSAVHPKGARLSSWAAFVPNDSCEEGSAWVGRMRVSQISRAQFPSEYLGVVARRERDPQTVYAPSITVPQLSRPFRPHRRYWTDPPPLKWSDLRYVFDIKEDCNGKEAIQA